MTVLNSALTDPDAPPWPAAPGHNADVSRLIRAALRRYAAGKAQPSSAPAEHAYRDAYREAARCLPLRRSPHQDMFIHYALGSALVGLTHLSDGIEHLDAAVSYAEAGGDLWASAELADLLGVALRGLGRFLEAEDVYRDGLAALEDLRVATPLQHPSGLRLQVGLAAMLQANERFDEAAARVMIARAGAIALGDREAQAGMDLTEANVQRARGNPHAALALILAARDGYVAVGETRVSRLMLGRVQAFAAEMALDVAELYAARDQLTLPSTYIDLAGSFARQGLALARATGEPGARYFSLMAQARHARASGRLGSARILLEPLLAEAERMSDPRYAIQVHMAIGQDHTAQGDHERALAHFRRAMREAEALGDYSIGGPARRAVLRASAAQ